MTHEEWEFFFSDAAIYRAEREPEKREPEFVCFDCRESADESLSVHHGDVLCHKCYRKRTKAEPAPSRECARVKAARLEWQVDFGRFLTSGPYQEKPLRFQKIAGEIIAKWEPRLSEFTPCGDCRNCLDAAALDEQEEAEIAADVQAMSIGDSAAQFRGDMQEQAMKRRTHENLRRVFGEE